MENLTPNHWVAKNRVLSYRKGTIDFGLIYKKGAKNLKIISYSYSHRVDDA